MKLDKNTIEQKSWQERYSLGINSILQVIKVRKEKIKDAVKIMEKSSEPKVSLVKKVNLCMLNMFKNLETSMEQKVVNFSSYFS